MEDHVASRDGSLVDAAEARNSALDDSVAGPPPIEWIERAERDPERADPVAVFYEKRVQVLGDALETAF